MSAYTGRFAPSPTGPLHAGSMVAALASWLDAKARGGTWLLRIEDVDTPRCIPGAARIIIEQLANCGLHPDQLPAYQSQHGALYQTALAKLIATRRAYACACSRQDIETALVQSGRVRRRGSELIYPGTCRQGLAGEAARSWRFAINDLMTNRAVAQSKRAQAAPVKIAQLQARPQAEPHVTPQAESTVNWTDRELGAQSQNVLQEVGDFVLQRADDLWAYQLAVVADDAAQGVTHIVRGADLLDNTARQILLQRALDLPHPAYLHVPVVNALNGQKLSKQNHAAALQTATAASALQALQNAGAVLGIHTNETTCENWLSAAARIWAAKYRRQQPGLIN